MVTLKTLQRIGRPGEERQLTRRVWSTRASLYVVVGGVLAVAAFVVIMLGSKQSSPDEAAISSGSVAKSPFWLPTSEPTSDDLGGEDALLEGTLEASDEGCLYVSLDVQFQGAASTTQPILVVWPDGFRSVRGLDGLYSVRDASTDVVATEGDTVSLSGGYASSPASHPCARVFSHAFWMPRSDI